MTPRTDSNTLERKILFFRADIGEDDGGRPLAFDPSPALDAINALPFSNDDAGRYESEADGNALCLINHSNEQRSAVQFCRVRRNGLPQLEEAGQVKDLDLAPETGLLEAMHIVFFPGNIVGAEYNHFGPRISRLGNYLHQKSNQVVSRVSFRPLLRGDAAEQLERLVDLRLFEFSILPSYVEITRQAAPSLHDAFAANNRLLESPETLQLVLQPRKEDRTAFLQRIKDPLNGVFSSNGFQEGSRRLQVRGKCADSGRVETIDLLKDHLVSVQRIVRMNERSRALDPDSAIQAIRDAYQQLGDDLDKAAGVSS